MITTGFNPYAARTTNVRNVKNNANDVAFKQKMDKDQISGLLEGSGAIFDDVRVGVAIDVIRAKDGALEQVNQLIEQHPTNQNFDWFREIREMLLKQK